MELVDQSFGVLGEGFGKEFDRDVALEVVVGGSVDLAHATLADFVGDGVGA